MSKKHQKKRNSALLYEFLVHCISKSLVEGDQKKSALALKILKRNFKPGSELYREFRLMSSLIKTTVSSDAVAGSILAEARRAAKSHDTAKLDREKSILIKHINHSLNADGCFYEAHIPEYKVHATVQSLLNDWRSPEPDIHRMAQYEQSLVEWLSADKNVVQQQMNEESSGTVRLLMKVMQQKLNEKYGDKLTSEQKALVKTYAFSSANDDVSTVSKKLEEIRLEMLSEVSSYASSCDNVLLIEKLNKTRDQLITEDTTDVSDASVSRFMMYLKLRDELNS